MVEDMTTKGVKPRIILPILKKQNPKNVSILKTIYNARYKFQKRVKAGRTPMQVAVAFFQQEGYNFQSRANSSTNELEDLFFAHPDLLDLWRTFPHVLLIDATYKTNKYNMPLLEIVGVTSTNLTFSIAFIFMHEENTQSYTWALECLKSEINGCMTLRVIVTDRELALMKACRIVFPEAKGLLFTWHINRSVMAKCKHFIKSEDSWNSFLLAWNKLVLSWTYKKYMLKLAKLEATLHDFPGVLAYLNDYWLIPHKEMFVHAWANQFLHFGNHTTNRVEIQHSKLKKYLEATNSNLERSLSFIHYVVESQVKAVRGSVETDRIVKHHRFNMPHFQDLWGFVSVHALEIIFKDFERANDVGLLIEKYGCQQRTSHGLPCAHDQAQYFYRGEPIPVDSIHKFWRTLDLKPCTASANEDFDCKTELLMFSSQFENHSRHGRYSFLRKIREIINPSANMMSEPTIRKTTRGRPSLKDQIFRKNCADLLVPVQEPSRRSYSFAPGFDGEKKSIPEPARHSCSAAPKFARLNDSQFPERARFNYHYNPQYFSHPYIDQLPKIFHPFITQVQDVRSDGNCGFRAIAVCLGFHEESWHTIRCDLLEELQIFKATYVDMFGENHWETMKKALNFFDGSIPAPFANWMTSEMGILIASRYNVILHILSIDGSVTYLPLRSSPPILDEHVRIAIGFVNDGHYVKVVLEGGYPMPTITPQWEWFKSDIATCLRMKF